MSGFHERDLTALQWTWILAAFSLAAVLCLLAFLLPMRYGIRRLENERR
jgi:hypothetical protein